MLQPSVYALLPLIAAVLGNLLLIFLVDVMAILWRESVVALQGRVGAAKLALVKVTLHSRHVVVQLVPANAVATSLALVKETAQRDALAHLVLVNAVPKKAAHVKETAQRDAIVQLVLVNAKNQSTQIANVKAIIAGNFLFSLHD